jgi:hypothetical protein
VNEGMMKLGQRLFAHCEVWRRVDDLIVDHPALLARLLAHVDFPAPLSRLAE